MKKYILLLFVISFLIFLGIVTLNHDEPFDKRELTPKYSGGEILKKDTFWHCLTIKMPDGEIKYTGWWPKDDHYKEQDTIK